LIKNLRELPKKQDMNLFIHDFKRSFRIRKRKFMSWKSLRLNRKRSKWLLLSRNTIGMPKGLIQFEPMTNIIMKCRDGNKRNRRIIGKK
jgi:hypothetical protein